ncbi:MAG: hypothetical protein KC457_36665, partial [Myxococcales bacterium]|nr:hypothetical protein [Myxococcales bacterium]
SSNADRSSWTRDTGLPTLGGAQAITVEDETFVCALVGGRVACTSRDGQAKRWWKIPRLSKLGSLVRSGDLYCGLGSNGRARCWSAWVNKDGFDSFIHGNLDVRDVVELAGGDYGVCARTRVGKVACYFTEFNFFAYYYGSKERAIPVEDIIDWDAVEIDAGKDHFCARVQEGDGGVSRSIYCWGDDARGQLGEP